MAPTRPDPIPFTFKCDARWDDMLGSGGKRLCTRCNTPVVDLSRLSESEAQAVLATPGVCVNYLVENGEVVYGRKRGEVDPNGAALRARSRSRGRRRRLVRWASAAASVAAAGGVVWPGAAAAGPAASEESGSFERIRSWVSSWFEDESCQAPVELGGAVAVDTGSGPVDTGTEVTPKPPVRLGGKPVPRPPKPPPTPVAEATVEATVDGATSLEISCSPSRQRAAFVDGRATATGPDGATCTVTVRGLESGVSTQVTLDAEHPIRCRMFDEAFLCE